MKRTKCSVSLLLAALMLLSLVSCGGNKPAETVPETKPETVAETTVETIVETVVETEAPETKAPETKAPETKAPETKAPETKAPETKAPETKAPETKAPETKAPETKAPETKAPETKAPETKAPETKAPETKAPETKAPETKAPETKAPETKAPETKAPETKAPETEPEPLLGSEEDRAFLKGKPYRITEEAPYFSGRWFEKELDGVSHHVTTTDGSAFYFLIDGASSFDLKFTTITVGHTPYFSYRIDGSDPIRQKITQPTVKLPDQNKHVITVYADAMDENENKWSYEKGFALKEVIPSDGGRIVGVKPIGKTVFFFGDSITQGIRALLAESTAEGNSATGAYPYFCAEKLNAVPYFIGYGGTGIKRTGSFTTFLNAIDNLSISRQLPDDAQKPDMIVINHGTNDWDGTAKDFKSELAKALDRLIEKYPGTPIVYMIPFCQNRATEIRSVAKDYPDILVVETKGWKINYTDTLHPTKESAKMIGESLADAIVKKYGEGFFK